MGGQFTYQPKWDRIRFDNHSHMAVTQPTGAKMEP